MKRIFAAVVALGIAFAFAQSSSAQTASSDLFVVPQRTTTAGGVVVVLKSSGSKCAGPVTSPGFVAPIEFTHQNADGSWLGIGEVIGTPGSYTAYAACEGHLVERTFVAGPARS